MKGIDIAIVGMAGKFPGSDNINQFWNNILEGNDCITRSEQLVEDGDGYKLINAYGAIKNPYYFDNEFFNVNSHDAIVMEPQERLLLECAYTALEDAGCISDTFEGIIGIVCGTKENEYYLENRYNNREKNKLAIESEKFLNSGTAAAGRISYKLNLKGPSVIVNTTCATSLSAVHIASEMLINNEADIMLAGGANVSINQKNYVCIENMSSEQGVLKAFDRDADGFVPGNGVGIVVLKRLKDAVKDKDHIYAIIKGSALGNDGADKIGFTAPSIYGETYVINKALERAGIKAEDVSYVETHGTATKLGDAIELRALKRVFENKLGNKKVALGSLKSNFGHMNSAAGIAGIIKAALMLDKRIIPPTINVKTPNAEIDKFNGFYFPTYVENFPKGKYIGVSSFGLGGMNAHLIMGAYESNNMQIPDAKEQLFLLSARSKSSLDKNIENFVKYIDLSRENLCDIAYTLNIRRKAYDFRIFLITDKTRNIIFKSRGRRVKNSNSHIIFMCPGTGSGYSHMGEELRERFPVFKKYYDECLEIGEKIRLTKLPSEAEKIFSCTYAMGKTIIQFGIKPDLLIGHSFGEYAAAALAGILTLEDALYLVIHRARIIEKYSVEGKMIVVVGNVKEIQEILKERGEIAGINAENRVLISGKSSEIEAVILDLDRIGVPYITLNTNTPAHSSLMKPVVNQYKAYLKNVTFYEEKIPILPGIFSQNRRQISMKTIDYWCEQLTEPLNFVNAIKMAEENDKNNLFIDLGPGKQLQSLAQKNVKNVANSMSFSLCTSLKTEVKDLLCLLGDLWNIGESVDLNEFFDFSCKVASIPTQTYEKKEFNISNKKMNDESCPLVISDTVLKNIYASQERMAQRLGYPSIRRIQGLEEIFDDLVLAGAAEYFRNSNIKYEHCYTLSELMRELEIQNKYIDFFKFLLGILEKRGYLLLIQKNIKFSDSLQNISGLNEAVEICTKKNPAFQTFFEWYRECVNEYSEVFQGKKQGNEILYPSGSYKRIEEVSANTPNFEENYIYVNVLPEILDILLNKTNKKISVLEVGGGTGIITWPVMEMLKNYNVEYYFTDIGTSFVAEAKKRAELFGFNNMKFEVYNIEKSRQECGLEQKQFDIILNYNVLTATTHIVKSVRNLWDFLKNNGVMLSISTCKTHDIISMIYGYAPGWWNYKQDPIRYDKSIFPSVKEFIRILRIAGIEKTYPICMDSNESEAALFISIKELEKINYTNKKDKKQNKKRDEIDCNYEVKQAIEKIISDTIGAQNLDATEDLYSIGIDSLAMLIIKSKLSAHFQLAISIKDLYACGNIIGIVHMIERMIQE